MRSIGYVLALAALWVMLWGSASAANVLSGLAIGTLLLVVLSTGRRAHRGGRVVVRPIAVARLAWFMATSAVRSNLLLTREILASRHELRASVETFPLPGHSDELATLISNLLAITPGTLPLDVGGDPCLLRVHMLELESPERSRASVERLITLCAQAFGAESP